MLRHTRRQYPMGMIRMHGYFIKLVRRGQHRIRFPHVSGQPIFLVHTTKENLPPDATGTTISMPHEERVYEFDRAI